MVVEECGMWWLMVAEGREVSGEQGIVGVGCSVGEVLFIDGRWDWLRGSLNGNEVAVVVISGEIDGQWVGQMVVSLRKGAFGGGCGGLKIACIKGVGRFSSQNAWILGGRRRGRENKRQEKEKKNTGRRREIGRRFSREKRKKRRKGREKKKRGGK